MCLAAYDSGMARPARQRPAGVRVFRRKSCDCWSSRTISPSRRCSSIRCGKIGYAVDSIGDGMAADALLRHQRFDLIVLDLGLPGLDGLDVLRRLRAKGSTTPVLILSGRDADDE